ncbi:hypothetical protein G9A89_023871 [Geosiphon pyriformis]|nr:hypothetical protein G9A89_023871 [Geosiphon pyriformis]
MVLDHLVVENELILEPNLVKTKSLEYVVNDTFSNIICLVNFDELLGVVSNLPNGKAAGFSEVSNELWKHCDKSVLDMFLVLLNFCLSFKSVLGTWKEAWVLMIPKPYEWEKILSDKISLVCSSFNILHGNNFLVFKGITMQSPIFAIAYDFVGWEHLKNSLVRIKMCDKFIRFFGGIHNGHVNKVITDFGLTDRYQVHDDLDQGEVFLPLLWHIFYDPLLCEVKRQESIYGYKINSHFTGLTSFLVASAFTVTILINCKVACPNFSISGSPISIAKKRESHHYLGIFLLTESFSRPSLAKTDADVKFFANLVLRKTIFNKQFSYLVSTVLHPIVSYRTQFSFVPISMCNKWDFLICRGLKLKSGLSFNFSNNTLCHPSLYGLKTFEQVQAESKVASIMYFANSVGILDCLFLHRSHDLQVLFWSPLHSLAFPVCIKVSASNNFLADVICIFLGCVNNSFHFHGGTLMSSVLGRLDLHGPVFEWFRLSIDFLDSIASFPAQFLLVIGTEHLDILKSSEFGLIYNWLLDLKTDSLSVYTDGSLKGLGSVNMRAGAVVFFEDISLGLRVRIFGLMSSTLAKLQEETKVATKTPTLTVLEFCHAIYTQNQSDLRLPEGCCLTKSALTYYINAKINYHIGKEEKPHDMKLRLYRELSQYTTKEVAVIAATIVKIYYKIEQYANENFLISTKNTRECIHNPEINYEKNHQKLGTPTQMPKKNVVQSEELNIREVTFRGAQENIIPPPLRPINPPAENNDKMTTPYIMRLMDFSGEKEEMDVHIWLKEA